MEVPWHLVSVTADSDWDLLQLWCFITGYKTFLNYIFYSAIDILNLIYRFIILMNNGTTRYFLFYILITKLFVCVCIVSI
jgi:hypothetical protein